PLGPPRTGRLPAVDETIMQAERAVAPELDLERADAKAAPIGRTRHLAQRVLRGVFRDLLLERPARFHCARLRRRPATDLGFLRPRREIGIRLRRARLLHRAAQPHLFAETLPVKAQSRIWPADQLDAFGAFI